jgi:hypothetical protein
MHIRSHLLGYGALGLAMAAAFVACAADQGDATKPVAQPITTGTSGSNVIDASSGSSGTGTTGSTGSTGTTGDGTSGTFGSGTTTGSATGAGGVSGASGAATGSTGTTTGASGAATGATGSATGSTGTVTGSTGTIAGSTGTLTGSTGTVTGSTGATGTTTGSTGTTGSGDDAGMDAGFTGTGCAPGAMVVMMTPSGMCGTTNSIGGSSQATLGAVCVEFKGNIPQAWAGSNTTACNITVTGGGATQMVTGAKALTAQPPMTAGPDGYVYWNLTAGCPSFAEIYCY